MKRRKRSVEVARKVIETAGIVKDRQASAAHLFREFSPGVQDYWAAQSDQVRTMRVIADWNNHVVPEMQEWAHGFNRESVFVLGSGPSLERVKAKHWEALSMKSRLVIGVNQATAFVRDTRGYRDVVKLATDVCFQKSGRPATETSFRVMAEHQDDGWRILTDQWLVEPPHLKAPHDWRGIFLGGMPSWRWSDGLCTTGTISDSVYERASLAAIHLAGLLMGPSDGRVVQRAVYLLGCDYGPDMGEKEPSLARRALKGMESWLGEQHISLMNVGDCFMVKDIKSVSLDRALDLGVDKGV